MISLNHILLFIAIAAPLAVLGSAWTPGGILRGWRTSALVVLAITGVAWLLFRPTAGYIGGGAWLALLFTPAVALRKMNECLAQNRFRAARKFARLALFFHPSRELREQITLLQTLEERQARGLVAPPVARGGTAFAGPVHRLRTAQIVTAIILLNIAVFLLELVLGLNRGVDVFHPLGALEFWSVVYRHQYWRVIAALFLHYDYLHLLCNLFALYILGPPLEWTIGRLRFAACYLLSGIGSSLGVLALMAANITSKIPVVGASGCVMGIVGTWAGFLLRHRHAPYARERLANIVMIIVIQLAFDRVTPQISGSAHLCGLTAGFLVGLCMGPKSAPGPRRV